MTQIGPFLPGSVRRSLDRRRNAKREVKVYEGQPIFNYAIAQGGGRRCKDKRIPKSSYELVKHLTKSYRRVFGADAEARLCGEDRKAWDYLWKRRKQMDYGRFRKRHLVIGSGMIESARKILIGSRLAGHGMRWRFKNGLYIASLRAAMRSRL